MNTYNLIGKRFGRLTVIEEAPRGKQKPKCKWYRCKCDCGNEIVTYTPMLTEGITRSCGCLQKESRFVDITGQTKGYLTAIRPTGKVVNGSAEWEWKCVCGNTILDTVQNVGKNGRTSCGCRRKELNIQQAVEMREKNAHNFVEGTNLKTLENTSLYRNNTSGVKGVSWHSRAGKWVARIGFQGKCIRLGYFSKLEDAAKARKEAEEKYFAPILEKYKDEKDK